MPQSSPISFPFRIVADLEQHCPICQGYGNSGWDDEDNVILCTNCDGTGLIPTSLGRDLIAFFRTYLNH